jgi:hypothetical protein
MNNFFATYLQHLISNKKVPFLTSDFIPFTDYDKIGMKYLPIIFSLMDLKLSDDKTNHHHNIKSDGKRGITITLGSNAIVFKKEVKEGKC